jgi:hypothetical protein
MSKSLNFVYEWIGPNGPITNNRLPTIADFTYAQYDIHKGNYVQNPHFYTMFKNYNIVPSCDIKHPDQKFLYEINFSGYHYRDWTKVLSDAFAQTIIRDNIKYGIELGMGYVLFTVLFEGWAHDKMFDVIHTHFEHHNLPLQQVIYVTNCQNGAELYKDYCVRRGKQPLLNVEYIPTFRLHRTCIETPLRERNNNPYTPGPRKKDFLCFQRRWSDHRLVFFMSMWKKGLLDRFYMSLDKTQPESGRSFESNMTHVCNRYLEFEFTKDDVTNAETVLPLTLDTNDFSKYPMESSATEVEDFYKNSLINIISETYFFSPEIHLNEKTFKPIAFKQPFIIMAAPKSLKHLKELGFKTFDKWWDESYDLEVNNVKRMQMINSLVEEISNWTPEKKVQFTYEVKDIVEYNCEHLDTMIDPEIINFEEKYGN